MRWLFLALALCACGDNLVGVPFSEFEAAADRARCARLTRCGLFEDLAACDGFFRKRPDADLAAAISAGLVKYSGPSAEECFEALAAQSCDTSSRDARTVPLACTQMFRGTGLPGESCTRGEECRTGICDLPACGQLCCRGSCHDFVEADIGERCSIDSDCVGDTFCGPDEFCRALGGDGALCDDDAECEFGFACIGPTSLQQGNCRKQPLLGEACLFLRCAEIGARCDAGVCVPLGLPGDPCTSAAECSTEALCDTAVGRCIAVPRLGEPCTSVCAGEAWCDVFDTNSCTAPKIDNVECTSNDQCASLFCEEGVIFDFCAQRPPCF